MFGEMKNGKKDQSCDSRTKFPSRRVTCVPGFRVISTVHHHPLTVIVSPLSERNICAQNTILLRDKDVSQTPEFLHSSRTGGTAAPRLGPGTEQQLL